MGNVLDGFPEGRTPEEQVAWLRGRIDDLEARYEARIRALETRQQEVEQRIAAHERRLEQHERRLAQVEAQIEAIRRGDLTSEAGDEDWDGFQTRH
ncbi:hypothetical protein [Azospirillum sp. ST 5-10]|uniref:hypothetical protein n=1 Tax=unclassified Azospirillum TaxID=2630922 RepID=UPI003F4A6AD8